MKRIVFVALCLTLFPVAGSAQVSFFPERSQEELEGGIMLDVLLFRDGDKRISYTPPTGWNPIPVSAAKIEFSPALPAGAVASVTAMKGASSLSEESLASLFRSLLPKDAVLQDEIAEPAHPLTKNRAQAWEFSAKYMLGDTDYRRSALFLCYRHAGFCFQIVAKAGDFDKVRKNFLSSLYTWAWSDDEGIEPATVIAAEKDEDDDEAPSQALPSPLQAGANFGKAAILARSPRAGCAREIVRMPVHLRQP